MENSPVLPPKKRLGPLAWIGIGCGGIVVLGLIAMVVAYLIFGDTVKEYSGKLQNFAAEAQKDPTRATANMMVGMGQFEMVAEDEANKRYTVKEKKSGALTTIYWSEKKKAPEVISGDFTAIPADDAAPATPEPAPPTEVTPAPAQ